MLVDGESMLNDATAIVAFNLVMGIILSGNFQGAALGHALVNVIMVLLGGALVGVLLGTLMRFVIAAAESNALIQFVNTLVIAYFAFLLADTLHASGVVAVLAAGLVVGRYKADLLKTEVKVRLDDLWELVAALANSLIFLLVGLTAARFFIDPQASYPAHLWTSVIWAIVAAIAARGVMIFALTPIMNPFLPQGPIDLRYQTVSFWGGLRGAVALALVLSLAADFPHQEMLVAMTLGVALFTIIAGGLSVGLLIRRFRLDTPEPLVRLEEAQAHFLAQQSATERLEELRVWQPLFPAAFSGSEKFWASKLEQASQDLIQTWKDLQTPSDLTPPAVWQQALQMERWGYQEAHDRNMLSKKTFDRLDFLVHLKDDALRAGRIPPPAFRSAALERPLGKWLAKMLGRLRAGSGRGREEVDPAIQPRYEFDLAVAVVGKRVAERVLELGRQLAEHLDPAIFEACANWYAAASQKIFQRLQGEENEQPELFQAIQRRFITRAIQFSARERLAKLATDGIVSDSIAQKLAGGG
jgi:CPA1 family monovalent cation:H+ antiporter